MSETVTWSTDTHVIRTISDDSFNGWEDTIVEAVKNSLDAKASRIEIDLPDDEILVPGDRQRVVITDNGDGMSLEEVQNDYCRIGRPKEQNRAEKQAPSVYGSRGTGKIANVVVADAVRLETWQNGKRFELEFDTELLLNSTRESQPETAVEVSSLPTNDSGTRLILLGFRQGVPPISTQQLYHILLRHFHHLREVEFAVNGEIFVPSDHAELAAEFNGEYVESVGTLSGGIWIAGRHMKEPGVVVYADGQRVHGPDLFGLMQKGYKGDFKRVSSRLLGQLSLEPEEDQRLPAGAWTLSKHFKKFEQWLGEKLEMIVDERCAAYVDDRVKQWLADTKSRKLYNSLDDSSKAAAKRILHKRAKKAGQGSHSTKTETIIARLVLRSLQSSELSVLLGALDDASDITVGVLAEVLGGQDPWTLRQVAMASSSLKHKQKALDLLEECVADYKNNENAIHSILEENPWILADDFHSFRSNRQIDTTLRKLFNINAEKTEATRKRPDFIFVLGDSASHIDEKQGRFLFVELKGPDQPLKRNHQTQAVGDATTFLEHRPGFAHVVLLGTEFAPRLRPDTETKAPGVYSFQSMTYKRLLDRARFRLSYMLDEVEVTQAEEVARKVVERQLDLLVD